MLQSSAALRSVLADPNLSLAAKGALVYVLTQPSGRVVTRAELLVANSDPLGEIDAAIRELVRGGYLAAARPKRRGQQANARREGGSPRPPQAAVRPSWRPGAPACAHCRPGRGQQTAA
jgi:hypothetical protein